MRRPVVTSAAALVVVSALLASSPARAGDEAAAEALFLEAKKLAAEGKIAAACPKFAESNRLDRAAGTLIHLGDCYEKNRQTASAWATFKEAASAAQALGRPDWQKLAAQRALALEPKLAKLTITVHEPAPRIEVTRDGSPMSSASWGTALPVDVGTHTVRASAPGRKSFKTEVTVTSDGQRADVVVPKLTPEADGAAAASSDKPPSPTSDGSTQRTLGFIVGGMGIAGVAFGAVSGIVAMNKNESSKDICPEPGACPDQGAIDDSESAKSFATMSNIGFVAGGVALVAGAVLVLTSGSKPAKASTDRGLRVVPTGNAQSAGVTFSGVF